MAERVNFTKQLINNLPIPAHNKRLYVYDQKIPGLAITVTHNGTKSFIVYKKINGKPQRIKLGRFPDLTVEQARKEAQMTLGKIARGINPTIEQKENKARLITLAEIFEAYLKARKHLKPGTIKDYQRIMQEVFADWQTKPMQQITKEMIAKRHAQFGLRSKARANNAMRVLRALFNFAAGEYEDYQGQSFFPQNPVARLSHTRTWYRVERRQTIIKPHELAKWFKAVLILSEDRHNSKAATVRDYLLLILFTGLRRQEAASIKWREQIDFEAKTLTIYDTKNHQPHTLPLSDFLLDMLVRRTATLSSEYLFPGEGKQGYMAEPRKQMQKVIQAGLPH